MKPEIELLTTSLIRLQTKLQEHGIRSALIGGLALAIWARPRVTKDVDLKVLITREEAPSLLEALGNEYESLHPVPLEALQRQGLVFVQDSNGIRIDLLLAETSFDREAIDRAKTIELQPGLKAKVVTAEDLIIYKMISTRKQDEVDVEQVIRIQGNKLNDPYVIGWLEQFEKALDDSTLVLSYRQMRQRYST